MKMQNNNQENDNQLVFKDHFTHSNTIIQQGDSADFFESIQYHSEESLSEFNLPTSLSLANDPLSEQELILLKISAAGADLRTSAAAMSKCVSRIKQYRCSITRKLSARNFMNALAIALTKGIIVLD